MKNMKDVVQELVKERFGFTPIKGDISIKDECEVDGVPVRLVKVGTQELYVSFEITGRLVGDTSNEPQY